MDTGNEKEPELADYATEVEGGDEGDPATVHSEDYESPAVHVRVDAAEAVKMSHTIIGTDVRGFGWAVAAGVHGLEVRPLDYRSVLREEEGPDYVDYQRRVRTVKSFLDEIRRRPLYANVSTLSASETTMEVTAVYDDHEGGPFPRLPGRRTDQLLLELGLDTDLKSWMAIDGRPMGQEAFSDAIEERLHTIVEPDQADLLSVIENLRITSNGHAESRINRANGTQIIELHDEHKVSAGTLTVPDAITFRVPVHQGATVKYDFAAWFRVRLERGEVKLHVKLKPYRQTYLAAWRHVLDDIDVGLGVLGGEESVFAILEV